MFSARIPLSGTERGVASARHASSGTAPDAIPLASGATAPQSVGAGGHHGSCGARVVIWTPPAPTTTEVDG